MCSHEVHVCSGPGAAAGCARPKESHVCGAEFQESWYCAGTGALHALEICLAEKKYGTRTESGHDLFAIKKGFFVLLC